MCRARTKKTKKMEEERLGEEESGDAEESAHIGSLGVHHLVSTTAQASGRRRGSGRHAQEAQCTPPAKSNTMEAAPAYPRENEASVLASLLGKQAIRFTDIS